MQRIYLSVILITSILLIDPALAQKNQKQPSNKTITSPKPKLVVGLVIDQMRWDYLHRYLDLYEKDGFRRLLDKGFSCDNTFITHLPTYTAVGHAGIYTGAYPSVHGIVGNEWYDHQSGKNIYCTEDSTVHALGGSISAGKMSPRNLQSNTITDELRLSNQFHSKVIGISLKDRGAIIPAGFSANAAYWYDDSTGTMMSSDYYMPALSAWVNAFNQEKRPEMYVKNGWSLLLPKEKYTMSTADEIAYEGNLPGTNRHVFPYTFNADSSKLLYKQFRTTPMSMKYSFDFAKKAIENEQLGKSIYTDFLALSISSTDYIGHTFGPHSMEIEDAYLRLDAYLADFMQYLDQAVGKENYVLFLSADHGAAQNPGYLNDHGIEGGVFKGKELLKQLNDSIEQKFKIKHAVGSLNNYQLYFSPEFDQQFQFSMPVVTDYIIEQLEQKPFVSRAFSLKKINETTLPDIIKERSANSWNKKRSGEIQMILEPGYFEGYSTGTTHGTWNPYDAHIPLLWYGWGIQKGATHQEVHMTDIAPTLAALLHIQMPNGSVGRVIQEVIK